MSFSTYRGRRSTLSLEKCDSLSGDEDKENSFECENKEDNSIVYDGLIKNFKDLQIRESVNKQPRRKTIRKNLINEIAEMKVTGPLVDIGSLYEVEEPEETLSDIIAVKMTEKKEKLIPAESQVKDLTIRRSRNNTSTTSIKRETSLESSRSQGSEASLKDKDSTESVNQGNNEKIRIPRQNAFTTPKKKKAALKRSNSLRSRVLSKNKLETEAVNQGNNEITRMSRHNTFTTPIKKEASLVFSNSRTSRESSRDGSFKSSQSQLCSAHVPTKCEERIRERHLKNAFEQLSKQKSLSLMSLKNREYLKLDMSSFDTVKKEKQLTIPISPKLSINKPREDRVALYHPVQDICNRLDVKSPTRPISPKLILGSQINKHNTYLKQLNQERDEQEERNRKIKELTEKREIAELRKKMVFTANKVPDFVRNSSNQMKPPLPQKKLTIPKSPNISKP